MLALIVAAAISSLPYSWRNVEIVGGGFVTGVIPHPGKKDLVYARTDIGGAYRWNPKTGRWIPLQDFLTRDDWNLYGAESVAIDPSEPKRVYIAAGTYTNSWGGNGAILRSSDAGNTWQRTDLTFKNGGNEAGRSMGERLSVDPHNGQSLLFGTRRAGLWRSSDRGVTWSKAEFSGVVKNDGVGIQWTLFDPKSPAIYVGTTIEGSGIWKSTDSGKTWLAIRDQPAMIPHQAKWTPTGELVVVYGNKPGPNDITDGAVFRYYPSAEFWKEMTPEKPAPGNTFGYGGVAIDARNPDHILVSTLDRWAQHDTVFRTTDGGKSWKSLKDSAVNDATKAPFLKWDRPIADFGHWIGDVEIDPFNSNRAWYVTGATIWSTDNLGAVDNGGKTIWVPRAEGLEETAVIDLISPTAGANLVSALGDIGGFRHDDFRVSPKNGIWTNPVLNSTTDLDYAGIAPLQIVRVGNGGGPQYGGLSLDGGTTWKPFSTPTGTRGGGTVAIAADGNSVVWATGGKAFYSADNGNSWLEAKGLPKGSVVISDKVAQDTYYGYSPTTGEVSRGDGTQFSVTSKVATGLKGLAAVFDRAGGLWLATPTGLMRSSDGGSTFRKVPGLELAEQVGFGKAAPGAKFATIYVIGRKEGKPGVFRSVDEGATWVRINDAKTGFGTMQVICGDPRVFGRVYVGTNGRGILVAEPR